MEIALVGNPNCGKTTLFNALTGSHQRVGNWSGVTVERKTGMFVADNKQIKVTDLPGTYSLNVISNHTSIDERIACEYILSGKPDLIVNIVDAHNLERSLYLTLQLLEMEVPVLLAVNMLDVAKAHRIDIDLAKLRHNLGCPVIGLEANKGKGIELFKETVVQSKSPSLFQQFKPKYPPVIESAIEKLMSLNASRWLAIRLLEDDAYAQQISDKGLHEVVIECQQQIKVGLQEDVDILLADSRYRQIQQILQNAQTKHATSKRNLTQRLDKIFLNRFLGIPLFLLIMYSMFIFAINIGGAFQDFFEISSDTLFVKGLSQIFTNIGLPLWFNGIVTTGVGLGITTTVGFIPVIGGMFLFLSFLESSGYMARAAFVMDRAMRAIGLPGKSFVPMIVGFGCNVPSVMASRTLENSKDRILTIMMSPFMSCGARLAIYAVFVAAFFPVGGQNIIFLLYIIGILMAVVTGLLLRGTILKGESSPLIMELPPYHIPTIRGLLTNTWHRLKSFLLKAGKVIIPLCVLIGFLNALTVTGKLNFEEGDKDSILSVVGKSITPVFAPMGIQENNWPATVGIATGLLAKEVVVATLNTLYTQVGDQEDNVKKEDFDFWQGLKAALISIPYNLKELPQSFTNPILASAPHDEVSQGVYGQMYERFDGQAGAFAYLLFLLLYFPCVSTTAVMVRELNRRWTLFSICWTTGVAYCVAVAFYQTATFSLHPMTSAIWLLGIILLFSSAIIWLRYYTQLKSCTVMEAKYGVN